MWQRFTERARKAVFYAKEEADKCGWEYVSTEHLLLGLCRQPESMAAQVLVRLALDMRLLQDQIERQLPRGQAPVGEGKTLTPRGKNAIDYAYNEAVSLDNKHIGTEHLLLGLLREKDGVAGRTLEALGVTLEAAKSEVIKAQAG